MILLHDAAGWLIGIMPVQFWSAKGIVLCERDTAPVAFFGDTMSDTYVTYEFRERFRTHINAYEVSRETRKQKSRAQFFADCGVGP